MVETSANQNVVINEGEILTVVPDDIIILNDPFMFLHPSQNENSVEFERIMLQNSTVEQMPFLLEENQVSEGMAVLEILCNHPPDDQPEFIDVNNLVLTDSDNSRGSDDSPVIVKDDDEDDDVIFVGEYPGNKNEDQRGEIVKSEEAPPRRNPVRRARNARVVKNLTSEILYEEDFGILDSTDSEDELLTAEQIEESIASTTTVDYKEWPVSGLHERPEYNSVTNKIEKFDYTIREIQKSVVAPKKAKIEPPKKPARKNKYKPTGRRKQKTPIVKKVKFNQLSDLISSTYEDILQCLKDFNRHSKNANKENVSEPLWLSMFQVVENRNALDDILKRQKIFLDIASVSDENEAENS